MTDIPPFLDRRNWTSKDLAEYRERNRKHFEEKQSRREAAAAKVRVAAQKKKAQKLEKVEARLLKKSQRVERRNIRTKCRKMVLDAIAFDNKTTLSDLQNHLTDFSPRQIKSAVRALTRNRAIIKKEHHYVRAANHEPK